MRERDAAQFSEQKIIFFLLMRLSTLILLSSVAVAIDSHLQVERATPGEEGLGSIPAVAARSLYWLGQSQYNVTD